MKENKKYLMCVMDIFDGNKICYLWVLSLRCNGAVVAKSGKYYHSVYSCMRAAESLMDDLLDGGKACHYVVFKD